MRSKVFLYEISLIVILCSFLFVLSGESFGFPGGSNGWHLNSPFHAKNNADLVCKVQVISIRQEEILKYDPSTFARDVSRRTATAKVLSTIKGECPQIIDIEFVYPKDRNSILGLPIGQIYTELSENEVCIVFLKRTKPGYKLNRIYSKARVPPEIVDYDLGNTPNLRLLSEFLAGCESRDEMIKLQAVEELGFLGDKMVEDLYLSQTNKEQLQRIVTVLDKLKNALRKMRISEDFVIRNAAYISSFQAEDSPGIEGPLKLLQTQTSDFDPNDSLKKYGIRDFCVSSLQLSLLETMDSTTRRFLVDPNDGSVLKKEEGSPYLFRGVRSFDYGEFYKQALNCDSVQKNEAMRSAIANVIWIRCEKRSVPDMVRLLDDENQYVRFVAVGSLMKYTGEGPERDGWEGFKETEKACIKYWKDWWQENKNAFVP